MKIELLSVLALGGVAGLGCGSKAVSLKELKSPAVLVLAAGSNPDGGAPSTSVTVSLSTDPTDCGVPGHDLRGTLDGVAMMVSDPGGEHQAGVLDDTGGSHCDPVLLTLNGVTFFPDDSVIQLIDGSATWEIKVHHLGTKRTLTAVTGFHPGRSAVVRWSDATDPLDPAKLKVSLKDVAMTPAPTVQGQEIHFEVLNTLSYGIGELLVENPQLVTACPSGVTCSTNIGNAQLDVTVGPE